MNVEEEQLLNVKISLLIKKKPLEKYSEETYSIYISLQFVLKRCLFWLLL